MNQPIVALYNYELAAGHNCCLNLGHSQTKFLGQAHAKGLVLHS